MEAVTLLCPLVLCTCHLDAPLTLDEARAPSIRLDGSWLQSISGRQLQTRGNVTLDRVTTNKLDLEGAHVGGRLSINEAKLQGGVIGYGGLQVDGDILCREVTAKAQVSLAGAEVGGKLDFDGATLHQDLDLSGAHVGGLLSFDGATLRKDLIAHGLRVGRSMFCRAVDGQRFEATGELQLSGANIDARLSFEGASLQGGMTAERLQVGWNMLCKNVSAKGEMRLLDAHIAGQLSFDGATLDQRLLADGVHVDQGMFCEGLTADAGVSVVGAHVGGQMSFGGARLSNENGPALSAYRLQIDGDMFCGAGDDRKLFESIGELRLTLAHVGGQLSLRGAHLRNKNGPALSAEELQVDGDMFCGAGDDGQPFESIGELRLRGAHFGGQLIFGDARLSNSQGLALDLENIEALELRLPGGHPPDGMVRLTDAVVGQFHDGWRPVKADGSGHQYQLRLAGFVYQSLVS